MRGVLSLQKHGSYISVKLLIIFLPKYQFTALFSRVIAKDMAQEGFTNQHHTAVVNVEIT